MNEVRFRLQSSDDVNNFISLFDSRITELHLEKAQAKCDESRRMIESVIEYYRSMKAKAVEGIRYVK
jgi:hypothetical protein